MNSPEDLYPSRTGCNETILPRLDPVVYGSTQPDREYSLDQEKLDYYKKNGYLILPDYMTEMVDPLLEEMDQLRPVIRKF